MAMQNGARDPLQLPQQQTGSAGSQLNLACSAPCGLLLSLLWAVPALAQPESQKQERGQNRPIALRAVRSSRRFYKITLLA